MNLIKLSSSEASVKNSVLFNLLTAVRDSIPHQEGITTYSYCLRVRDSEVSNLSEYVAWLGGREDFSSYEKAYVIKGILDGITYCLIVKPAWVLSPKTFLYG